jgi:hypothetical protein
MPTSNPFTSATAGPSMIGREQQALVANPEIVGLERQRKMAELLLAQGLKGQPQGEMVSGYYVPPAFTQRLAPVLNRLMGEQGLKDVDEKTMRLAETLRQRDESDTRKVLESLLGKQAVTEEMAGPAFQGVSPSLEINPAVAPNPQEAYRQAMMSQSPQVRAMLPTIAEQAIPKQITPYQQAQLDLEKQKFTSMTPYQQAQLGIERDRLELDKIKNLAKPLPEGLNKQVTGAVNLTDAISDYQKKIASFGVKDFANPNKRAEMGNAYNNMMLQAKEAYNLGVLNGPDYDILQRVVKDPTNISSLAFTNDALSKQADSLRNTAKTIVSNAYMSQGREAPAEIMAKFAKVEAPKAEKQSVKEQLGLSKAPKGVDPKVWNVMTPEEKALFK